MKIRQNTRHDEVDLKRDQIVWADIFQLVIHVGVDGSRSKVALEKRARCSPYTRKDVDGRAPQANRCLCPPRGIKSVVDDPEREGTIDATTAVITSGFDMDKACQHLNSLGLACEFETSDDCGL
jgi:hypothetical protein